MQAARVNTKISLDKHSVIGACKNKCCSLEFSLGLGYGPKDICKYAHGTSSITPGGMYGMDPQVDIVCTNEEVIKELNEEARSRNKSESEKLKELKAYFKAKETPSCKGEILGWLLENAFKCGLIYEIASVAGYNDSPGSGNNAYIYVKYLHPDMMLNIIHEITSLRGRNKHG